MDLNTHSLYSSHRSRQDVLRNFQETMKSVRISPNLTHLFSVENIMGTDRRQATVNIFFSCIGLRTWIKFHFPGFTPMCNRRPSEDRLMACTNHCSLNGSRVGGKTFVRLPISPERKINTGLAGPWTWMGNSNSIGIAAGCVNQYFICDMILRRNGRRPLALHPICLWTRWHWVEDNTIA